MIKTKELKPLRKSVFVTDLEEGVKLTRGGIILPDDNMRETGIRPRWAKVYAVGSEIDDLSPGDWVLVAHGRWTNRINLETPEGDVSVWRIDYPEAVIIVADENPANETISL